MRSLLSTCVVASSLFACHAHTPDAMGHAEPRPVHVGDAIAPFRAKRLDAPGQYVSIPGARVTMLAFLATWSEPDKKSIPKLEAIYRKYEDRGLLIVDVGIDDDVEPVLEFARTFGASFPVVWDERHAIAEKLRPEAEPCYVILDGKGSVRFVDNGYHDGEEVEMDAQVAGLL